MKKMLLFLCLSSLLTACSKKNDETISSCTFDYGLPNAHFIVYANKADWLAEKNPLLDSRMDETGKITLSGDQFVRNKSYYYDVYTDDGQFSNWWVRWPGDTTAITFIYQYGSFQTLPNIYFTNGIRKMCLETKKWRLSNVLEEMGDISKWSIMSDRLKDKELTFNKDFTATLHIEGNTPGSDGAKVIEYSMAEIFHGGFRLYKNFDPAAPNMDANINILTDETTGEKRFKVTNYRSSSDFQFYTGVVYGVFSAAE